MHGEVGERVGVLKQERWTHKQAKSMRKDRDFGAGTPPPPTWAPRTEQTNNSDLSSDENTEIPFIQKAFLKARRPPLPKNT